MYSFCTSQCTFSFFPSEQLHADVTSRAIVHSAGCRSSSPRASRLAMGFMNARRAAATVAPHIIRPPEYGYELERSVEDMARAANELRLQFPMEQAEHLWGVATESAQALAENQHKLHVMSVASTPEPSPRRAVDMPPSRAPNSLDYDTEGTPLTPAEQQLQQPERHQQADRPPELRINTSAAAVARSIAEKTEVKLGSAVAAAMSAVATATAQTHRVASKDVHVPKEVSKAVTAVRAEAAREQKAAVEKAKREALSKQREELERAVISASESKAEGTKLAKELVAARNECLELQREVERVKADRRTVEAVGDSLRKTEFEERKKAFNELNEVEMEVEQARADADDALALCATEIATLANRSREEQWKLQDQVEATKQKLQEATQMRITEAEAAELAAVRAEEEAKAAMEAALVKAKDEADAERAAAVEAAVEATTQAERERAAAEQAAAVEVAIEKTRAEGEAATARALELLRMELESQANAAADSASRAMSEAVEQAHAAAQRECAAEIASFKATAQAEHAGAIAQATAAAREAAREEAVAAATVAAKAAAEGSSSKVAEAAAESARLRATSEAEALAAEVARRHEKELGALNEEWRQAVESLEAQRAELEQLAGEEHQAAEARHRETMRSVEETRAELAVMHEEERRRQLKASNRLDRRLGRGVASGVEVMRTAPTELGTKLQKKRASTKESSAAPAAAQHSSHARDESVS